MVFSSFNPPGMGGCWQVQGGILRLMICLFGDDGCWLSPQTPVSPDWLFVSNPMCLRKLIRYYY